MGGRGSSSGGGGGSRFGSGSSSVIGQFMSAGGGGGALTGQAGSEITVAPFQKVGDYTAGNNADLMKWQSQTDDKSASFLSKLDNQTDLAAIQSQTNDPWSFYDNPFQKMTSSMGLNAAPTVMSESDFNNYVAQTGSTVLYRGWSGNNSATRFTQSPNSHVGNGINGDGYYFSADRGTARSYGGTGMKAALSPNARVVSATAVRAEIAKKSPKLQSALSKAGSYGTRTYGSNRGEAQMALKMGYNCIDAGWAVIPLTRDAVVVSAKRAW